MRVLQCQIETVGRLFQTLLACCPKIDQNKYYHLLRHQQFTEYLHLGVSGAFHVQVKILSDNFSTVLT